MRTMSAVEGLMQGGAAAPHLTKPTTQPCAAIPEVSYDLFQLPPCQQIIRLDTVLTGGILHGRLSVTHLSSVSRLATSQPE